ncbi:2-hydroxychromene-2-carboxylate isomerase [Rubrobacter xylanophilus DSM 9941]|uniref:2-hydroxychromene-2-carboxylate isomerase n=1 Tax=Rubrobacter xylanophilus TaxID=49319 RepID=UPI001C64250A|nr:2-hydroxychromene-2-carboxylate isomerase [Rubrobacter xylanophilus]QYJ17263.1 2-hydroxychromene-2-carboxylate isomerase [Rubrobacter xylanophilus DSM 9941]
MRRVEFYFDLVSPYSYLALERVYGICAKRGAKLVLRPVLLGAVHKLSGNTAPVDVPAKRRYQLRDIHRWAERYGVPLRFPDPFPFRTLTTMRAAVFLEGRGSMESFVREAFRLYWAEGGAPAGFEEADERGPVAEAARRAGLDPGEVLEGASSPEARRALREATGAAVERGVFGTPAFFVGEELFWGNDRLCFVEAALEGD